MSIETTLTNGLALEDFDTFFRATFPAVARAAALVARDPGTGQEVAQEAFFRAYERLDRFRTEEHARRFAFRVAINLARSHVRKHLRVLPSGLEPGDLATVGGGAWTEVNDALTRLSPRQRAAVVLVDYVGFDAGETGRILRISAGTVRQHLMRGRRALRQALGEDGEDER